MTEGFDGAINQGPFTFESVCTPEFISVQGCSQLPDLEARGFDFDILAGETLSVTMSLVFDAQGQDVPEPSSLPLLVTGLIGLIGFNCRKSAR